MTAKELEKIVKAAGWYFVRQCGSHRQYKNHGKKGMVTIPFHAKPKDINIITLGRIFKQAQLKMDDYV